MLEVVTSQLCSCCLFGYPCTSRGKFTLPGDMTKEARYMAKYQAKSGGQEAVLDGLDRLSGSQTISGFFCLRLVLSVYSTIYKR